MGENVFYWLLPMPVIAFVLGLIQFWIGARTTGDVNQYGDAYDTSPKSEPAKQNNGIGVANISDMVESANKSDGNGGLTDVAKSSIGAIRIITQIQCNECGAICEIQKDADGRVVVHCPQCNATWEVDGAKRAESEKT